MKGEAIHQQYESRYAGVDTNIETIRNVDVDLPTYAQISQGASFTLDEAKRLSQISDVDALDDEAPFSERVSEEIFVRHIQNVATPKNPLSPSILKGFRSPYQQISRFYEDV